MHKSISSEIFNTFVGILTAVMLIMSVFIIAHTTGSYKSERRIRLDGICAASRRAVCEDPMDEHLQELFSAETEDTYAEIMLINENGDVLACSEASPCSHYEKKIGSEMMRLATDDGYYFIGTASGLLDEMGLCVLYRIPYNGRDFFFLEADSAGAYTNFLVGSTLVVLVMFALIMIAVVPLLKFTLNRHLSPLHEMTIAAKRFGEGDFSQKVQVSDQTEMGLLANTLNEMASSLESIEENRKSFISNVSHELRTPMTTIGGFVDGILDGTIPPEQHKQYLTTVSEEINRLARLVRSMLNISKYEAGEMELRTKDFDITSLSVKTVLLFEKRIEGKKVDIRGLDSDRCFVNADMDLIQQVIYNLTENAVKFVDEGGYIEYSFARNGDLVSVIVRNSGEGLKKNEISKVFDRFYKTDASRGKDKTGVGLGLSIVRSIVKLHGGTVTVRSVPGEYTEFEFTVPPGEQPSRRQ